MLEPFEMEYIKENLRACPFCGSVHHVKVRRDRHEVFNMPCNFYVQCGQCQSRGPSMPCVTAAVDWWGYVMPAMLWVVEASDGEEYRPVRRLEIKEHKEDFYKALGLMWDDAVLNEGDHLAPGSYGLKRMCEKNIVIADGSMARGK